MSNNFLNETQFKVMVAAMKRRFDKVASIDPTEVAERMLADEEFRQKVMNAIAAIEFQLASNDQFGIAKGQQNDSPETWHRVSFIDGLGSINRDGLEAFIEQFIKALVGSGGGNGNGDGTGGGITYQDILRILGDIRLFGPDDLPLATNTGGHLTLQQATPQQYGVCKPRKNSPCYPQKTSWQTMNGTLEAQTKHDIHMFAPFSFPKEMPKRIKLFDRLTFIPINAHEKCCAGCTGDDSGSGNNPGDCNCKCPWNCDIRRDFTFNAYDPAKDFIQDFAVNTYDPAKDFINDFSVHAYNPTTDFLKDFIINAYDPVKDFIKDVAFDAKQTVDYTKTFSVEAIQMAPFTKNFSATVIQAAPFIKDFNMEVVPPSRWVNVTGSLPAWMRTVRFANNTFMIGCGGHSSSVNRMIDSTDAITWTPRAVPTNAQSGWWDSHAFGANTWVALGGQVSSPQTDPMAMTSPNGATWTTRTITSNANAMAWTDVIFANNQFVAVSSGWTGSIGPYIATSPNGITWTARTGPSGIDIQYLDSVAYGNGMYVSVGAKRVGTDYHVPLLVTSPDGINWTERSMPAGLNGTLSRVVFINNTFIALRGPWGSGRNLFTSPNGIAWTERTLPEDAMLYDIAYGNGIYVAVGYTSDLFVSSNLTTWTSEPSPPTLLVAKGFRSIAHGKGKFVAIRTNGDGIITSNF